MSRNKYLVSLVTCLVLVACTKKVEEEPAAVQIFTNCKLPIADGRGGVAIGGFPRYADRLASTGTVNATVIMVDFPDAAATMTPTAAFAKISGAAATFTEMSYGRMTYTMTPTLQWFRMSNASTQYDIGGSGHGDYIREAIALADSTVNFATTDSLVILANPDASGIGTKGPAAARSAGSGFTADGKEMLNVVTSAYDLNTWGSIWLNHEVTHTLGLIDLYAYTTQDSSNPYDILRYTGTNSYMGYNSFSANAPGLTAWERWVLGWLDDSQVLCSNPRVDGQINTLITPIGTTGGQKAVIVPLGATKVLVVESRHANGIDANIAKPGALVYTVDSSISSGMGAVQVYPISASDRLFVQAIRAAGESVSVGGYKVEVVASDSSGETVRISVE